MLVLVPLSMPDCDAPFPACGPTDRETLTVVLTLAGEREVEAVKYPVVTDAAGTALTESVTVVVSFADNVPPPLGDRDGDGVVVRLVEDVTDSVLDDVSEMVGVREAVRDFDGVRVGVLVAPSAPCSKPAPISSNTNNSAVLE